MANVLLLQYCRPSELQLLPCLDPATLHSNQHNSRSLSTQAVHQLSTVATFGSWHKCVGTHSISVFDDMLSIPAAAVLQA